MKSPWQFFIPVLLLACGGGASGGGSPTGPSTNNNSGSLPTSASVSLVTQTSGDGYGGTSTTNSFAPNNVTVARGGTVTWTNTSGVLHNVTFASTPGAPQNVANHADGSNTRTFDTAGTFTYTCTNHSGMQGTVVVK